MAQWLVHRTGDRGVLVSNPAGGTSLRNFYNYVYPTLPVSFRGYTKSCLSLLSGVYAKGSKIAHTRVTCRGPHNFEINHSWVGSRMGLLEGRPTYLRP